MPARQLTKENKMKFIKQIKIKLNTEINQMKRENAEKDKENLTDGVTTCCKVQGQNLDTPATFRQEPGYPDLGQTLISKGLETSQNESETYQTKCLKVTCLENDRESAANYDEIHSHTGLKEESGTYHKPTNQKKIGNQTECLKVTNDQTCLSQSAANYDEIHSQTRLKEESGTPSDKNKIINIESDNKSLSQANYEIPNRDLKGQIMDYELSTMKLYTMTRTGIDTSCPSTQKRTKVNKQNKQSVKINKSEIIKNTIIIFTLYALLTKSVSENNKVENKKEKRYKNKRSMYKFVITLALFTVVFTASILAYRFSTSYKEEKISHQLFGYKYKIVDKFIKVKTQDAKSKVAGSLKSLKSTTTRASSTTITTRNDNHFKVKKEIIQKNENMGKSSEKILM